MKIVRPAAKTLFLVAICGLVLIANSAQHPPSSQSTSKTGQAPRRLTTIPKEAQGPVILRLSSSPSGKELRLFPGLHYKLGSIDESDGTKTERAELAAALNAMQSTQETFAPLERFIQAHPTSVWTPSVKLNLGQLLFDRGYFSRALSLWKEASDSAAHSRSRDAKRIFSEALAHYTHLIATVGRKDELAVIASKIDLSTITPGPATILHGAFEGLEGMENRPGTAFRCGTYALVSMQKALHGVADDKVLDNYPSPSGGFSLLQIEEVAGKLKLPLVAVKRLPGSPLVIPSIVHWKLNHFGALIRQEGDRVLLRDPTFGGDHWVDANAVDSESTGYFLIPSAKVGTEWATVNREEKAGVFGKGLVTQQDPSLPPQCPKCCGDGGHAMAISGLSNQTAMLFVEDTPLRYQAAYGPSPTLHVVYHEMETRNLSTEAVSGFGYYWNCNWVGYVQDDPTISNSPATVWLPEGGYEEVGSPDATGNFNKFYRSDTFLSKVDADTYRRTFQDGSIEVYGRAIGATSGSRKLLITRRLDPQGRAIEFLYDTDPAYPWRLKKVVDASGLVTELFYQLPAKPGYITKVRDPFGREASFTYSGDFLVSTRDPIGITSTFEYRSSKIITITTPYGATKVRRSAPSDTYQRWTELQDPYDDRERMEALLDSDSIGLPSGSGDPTPDAFGTVFERDNQQFRNTFYWDKKTMASINGAPSSAQDYSKARRFHWLHLATGPNQMSGVLENEKRPFEGNIYYHYAAQSNVSSTGTSAQPSAVHRFVEDGNGGIAVSAERSEYNNKGRVTKRIDPVGRETVYEYDASEIDLRFVKQKVNGDYQTIQEIQYNPSFPPHLPWKITDPAGQITTYAYNARGQVTSITNALNEPTTFTYEENATAADYGKLILTSGALPGAITTFTYDSAQRVRTVTDTAGYTLTYDYDNLDRLTRVTYPDGTYEETGYDRLDPTTRRDRMGRITQTKYNANREPVLTSDPAQRVTQFEYCACGSMETLIDGNGNRTSWDFDVQGRQISKRYADGKGDDFAYEPLSGRLSSITDAKGQIKKFMYNLDGTLRKLDYQNEQVATPDVTYTYDSNFNRIATMVDGIGTHTYSYYSTGTLGALQVHTLDGPFTDPEPLTDLITYTYDELGRVRTRNIGPGGAENKVTWGYDAIGRTISEINNLCASGTQFTYDYVGTTRRLQSVDYPSGQRTLYEYWPANTPTQPGNGDFRLKQIANFGQGTDTTTLLSRFDYTYDPAGNIKTWHRKLGANANDQTYNLGYDNADQLTDAVLTEDANPGNLLYHYHASFDPASNRKALQENSVLTNYAINNLNQITSSSGGGNLVVLGHTDEPARVSVNGVQAMLLPGNQYKAIVPVSPGSNQLTVTATDFANTPNTRTKQWNVDVGSPSASAFNYDFNGNTTSDASGTFIWNAANQLVDADGPQTGHRYLFDGIGRRIAEVGADNEVIRRWIWSGMTLCEERTIAHVMQKFGYGAIKSGEVLFFTLDHLGSLREGVSPEVALQRRWDYSPNGQRTEVIASGGFGVPFGFTGHFQDSDDMIVAPFRLYQPSLSRWLSRDPINEQDGTNLYLYVHNDPTRLTDVLGLKAWKCYSPLSAGTPHWYYCVTRSDVEKECFGQCPKESGWGTFYRGPGARCGDTYNENQCVEVKTRPDQDFCLLLKGLAPRPDYSLGGGSWVPGPAYNCQAWRDKALRDCDIR